MMFNIIADTQKKHSWLRGRGGNLPVSLVQHEPADGAEGDAQRVLDVVHQTPRRGHQDVDAFTQPEDTRQEVSTIPCNGSIFPIAPPSG